MARMRVVIAGVAIASAVASIAAQTPTAEQKVSFEVAAVKPADPDARVHSEDCHDPSSPISAAGRGRCSVRSASLKKMILYAYGFEEPYLRGGPAWIATEAYSVEAKAEDPMTSTADLKRMLQNLLVERFKLQLHFMEQETTGYSLMVGKGTLKLKPGDPTAGEGGVHSGLPPTETFRAKNTSLDTLARVLSRVLSAPVRNATGLSEKYAIDLSWAANDESPGPTLSTALQDQLGLKLETTKVPVKVIVIDHAEKPTPN